MRPWPLRDWWTLLTSPSIGLAPPTKPSGSDTRTNPPRPCNDECPAGRFRRTAPAGTGCHRWPSCRRGPCPPTHRRSVTVAVDHLEVGKIESRPPARARVGAWRQSRARPLPATGCPSVHQPVAKNGVGRRIVVVSGGSFCRGDAAAILDPLHAG